MNLEVGGMSPSKQFHSPEGIAPPVGNGYTHAITAGGAIYVAGQIGMEPSGAIPEGFEAQAHRAFENLEAVLAAAGASLSDVVKVTVLLVELGDLAAYRVVREAYIPHRPASTLCVVKSLAMPELLFEIEAIAVPD
jgi:enamine deaminase RidA (YjgF/YER057c/UK114 family)